MILYIYILWVRLKTRYPNIQGLCIIVPKGMRHFTGQSPIFGPKFFLNVFGCFGSYTLWQTNMDMENHNLY